MAQVPHRLQPDTRIEDNLALINDNTDKLISNIGDLGANKTGGFSVTVNIASGGFYYIVVGVRSSDNFASQVNNTLVWPMLDIFVDTDADYNYILPNGSSLTTGQQQLMVTTRVAKTAETNFADEIATVFYQLYNLDTVDHTYYLYGRAGFMPSNNDYSGYFS